MSGTILGGATLVAETAITGFGVRVNQFIAGTQRTFGAIIAELALEGGATAIRGAHQLVIASGVVLTADPAVAAEAAVAVSGRALRTLGALLSVGFEAYAHGALAEHVGLAVAVALTRSTAICGVLADESTGTGAGGAAGNAIATAVTALGAGQCEAGTA